jgi:hypothetical protein
MIYFKEAGGITKWIELAHERVKLWVLSLSALNFGDYNTM